MAHNATSARMASVIILKGTYGLVLQVASPVDIQVGRLGVCSFPRGYYIYVGSALGGLDGRLRRHFRTNKTLHWHIDYLREKSDLLFAFWLETAKSLECTWAAALSTMEGISPHVKGPMESDSRERRSFGSSDCRCQTHLFLTRRLPRMESLKTALGCSLRRWNSTEAPC